MSEEIHLSTEIDKINRLSKEHRLGLKKLNLITVNDILNYLPARYADEREEKNIKNLIKGEKVILFGEIHNLKIKRSFRGHIPMAEAKLIDTSGSIKLVWFHQAYLAKIYKEGDFVKVSGLVNEKNNSYSILNPNIEKVSREHIYTENNLFQDLNENRVKELIPIYKETKGISSLFLSSILKKILQHKKLLLEIEEHDPIPKDILKELHLPNLKEAYLYLHFPKAKNIEKVKEQILTARKRFAYQEIFYIQLSKQSERVKAKHSLAYNINTNLKDRFVLEIEKKYKLKLTAGQNKAIQSICLDLEKNEPMSRLLEGDVGSGKTLVAEIITYLTTHYSNIDKENKKRLQVAIMAPTEILARQHFETFLNFFKGLGVEIGLLTSKVCKKFPSKINPNTYTNISKPQLKKWVADGQISIVIGTHALIQKTLAFQNLALVIIDEQHRFGVKQRAMLAQKKSIESKVLVANDIQNLTNKKEKIFRIKNKLPHLLSMTATPIPRTLALTIFGDLDLTLISELPKGRLPIITKLVDEAKRNEVYQEIIKEINNGYQAYIVVPRISELDEKEAQALKKLDLRSVESEVEGILKFLIKNNQAKIKVVGLHSKLKKEEKEIIMQEFLDNKIQILVSTSVIEVGVNVPNATRMIIEGGERFGLAQLHQLRGRIGRSERESICYIFSKASSEITQNRLQALLKAKNGFELSEYDLNQRGIGSLVSGKQWGISDLAMEAIKNLKLVEIARAKALEIINKDNELKAYPRLLEIIQNKEIIHFE